MSVLLISACGVVKSDTPEAPPTVAIGIEPTQRPGVVYTPTSTPSVLLTPRPLASGVDLAAGRAMEGDGDLVAAATAYVSIAASTPAARSEAILAAARLLLELDQPRDARTLLEPFAAAATGRDVVAHYLLARAYAALSLWSESLQQYDAYISSGRPATPYAYLDRALILLALGRADDAVQSVQDGLALGVPSNARRTFVLTAAQIQEGAGELDAAIAGYEALIDLNGFDGDDALALSRIVAIKRARQDPTYVEERNRLLIGYPGTPEALTALENAFSLGELIDPITSGLIYYRQNEYSAAEPYFRRQIEAAPDSRFSAVAYYYLGVIQESRGELGAALDSYARVTPLDPQSFLADDALWWRGRILEDADKGAEAQALFARITAEYPSSTWAPEAAFRRGMLSFGAGDYAGAAGVWDAGAATAATKSDEQRLTFWLGKALLAAGDENAARPVLLQLAGSGEEDYYGIRAASLLAGGTGEIKAARETKISLDQALDWREADSWLASRAGRALAEAWSSDNRWLRAQELWLVGRNLQAEIEALALVEGYGRDQIALYTLSRRLQAEGRTSMSARVGERLVRVLDVSPSEGLPRAVLSLAYPPAFGALVQKYAQAESVSPLLLLAFVRQESFYNPRAQSGAGALGLTQVLPDTAESIARRLRIADYDEDRLLQADLNLRLGASYMAGQLKDFDSELYVAFAAYNAGPTSARRWREAAGSDPDVFLENIEFSETRAYVEIVAQNYAIYRYLYGGEVVPSLPR